MISTSTCLHDVFKSSQRPISIPQSEHLKLAGALANLWGNARFELPPVPRLSLVAGIALHDRGYGYLDDIPIGEVDDDRWLAVTRGGFYMPCADPVADLITRHHLLRLVSGTDTPAHNALAQEMRLAIQQQIERNGFDAELFAKIDRMTQLCDMMSFDFCWEKPVERQVEVFARYDGPESTVVRYQIRGGVITVDSWPLQVEEHSGYLVGYQLDGYPERLDGLVIPYRIRPVGK